MTTVSCWQNLTKERIAQTDRHGLVLNVVIQSVLAQFTTNARLLEATERKLVVESVVRVDPDLQNNIVFVSLGG
jgi:hypothetical protein